MNESIFSIAHYADQGVLILLVLLAVVAMWLIFVKAIQFFRVKTSLDCMDIFSSNLMKGSWNGELPESLKTVCVGPLLQGVIDHLGNKGEAGLDEVFAVLKSRYLAPFESSLAFLATVGSNAPYIGLFGTVLGIMKSFHDMAQATDGAQSTVMVGISAALIATAAGLLVAIPSVLAFHYFQKRVKTMSSILDQTNDLLRVSSAGKRGAHGS